VVTILSVKGKHGEQENNKDDKSGGLECEPESIEDVDFDEEGQLILAGDIEPQEVEHSAQEQLGLIEAYVRSPTNVRILMHKHLPGTIVPIRNIGPSLEVSIFLQRRTDNFSDLLDLSYWRPLPTSHKEAKD